MLHDRKQLRMSAHGRHRAKNRAFRPDVINAILNYGRHLFAGSGCLAFFLGRKEVRRARRHGIRLDQFANRAIVLSPDFVVVTVAHVNRLPRHWRGA